MVRVSESVGIRVGITIAVYQRIAFSFSVRE